MQELLTGLIARFGPILTAMAAALCLILGIIIIIKPQVLAWLVGIGLMLAAVALVAQILLGAERFERTSFSRHQ